ncbi:hypothetical protein KNP414_06787 [Paenibacillus mucilaginosus KNP414]|uniref:Uncharacterized protein n=1 Tax=Paenibacillus mucilaginosus (strain KNP414) TaxID=1036673 RepID=F8FEI9_PAEMK|nr:hypothetical protein KNP414_06787 [Paenibacillus mucilaginosus KNP414]
MKGMLSEAALLPKPNRPYRTSREVSGTVFWHAWERRWSANPAAGGAAARVPHHIGGILASAALR